MRSHDATTARRADRARLTDLVAAARAAERRAPPQVWLEQLVEGDPHVGIPVSTSEEGWLLSVWAGGTAAGDRVGAVLELSPDEWLALAEVEVPAPVRRWALDVVADAAG